MRLAPILWFLLVGAGAPPLVLAHSGATDGSPFFQLTCPKGYSLQTKLHRSNVGNVPMARCMKEQRSKKNARCPRPQLLSIDRAAGGRDQCRSRSAPKLAATTPSCPRGYGLVVVTSGRDHCLKVTKTYRKPTLTPHR